MTGPQTERVLDAPAGRRVWCPSTPADAAGLVERLRWASERGVPVTRLLVTDADALPACDRVAEMQLDDADSSWSSVLAAVVRDDRADRVGGVRRPRPVVSVH